MVRREERVQDPRDPNVRARMNLSPSDPRLIDPKRMVLRGDTVYVLSKPRRDGGVSGRWHSNT